MEEHQNPYTWPPPTKTMNAEQVGFESTRLPSGVGRLTAEPYENTGIFSQPRYVKIARHPLAELDKGARSFGGYTVGFFVGWAWHSFAAASNWKAMLKSYVICSRIELKSHLGIIITTYRSAKVIINITNTLYYNDAITAAEYHCVHGGSPSKDGRDSNT